MKVYGKLLSLILAAAILCPVFSLMPASATGTGSTTANDTMTVSTDMGTVRVEFFMTAAEQIEDFEGYLQYDPTFLEFTGNTKIVQNVPNGNLMCNGEESGYVYFSAYDVENGYDFSTRTSVFSAQFKVLKNGSAEVSSKVTLADNMQDHLVVDYDNGIDEGIVDTAVAVNSLKISALNLMLESDLTVNFFVEPADIAEYTDVHLNGNGAENISGSIVSSGEYSGMYRFQYKKLNPASVVKDLKPVLCGTRNGVEYRSKALSYSVFDYCMTEFSILAEKDSLTEKQTAERTLLVDLLNYSAAAQDYIDDSSVRANASLTDEQKSWATQTILPLTDVTNAKYTQVSNRTVRYDEVSLNLAEAIIVKLKYHLQDMDNLNGVSLRVTKLDGVTKVCDDITALSEDNENGVYTVEFRGINANKMSEPVLITFMKNGSAISNTLEYSIESYVSNMYNGSDELLSNLVVAMMKYGRAAESYGNTN